MIYSKTCDFFHYKLPAISKIKVTEFAIAIFDIRMTRPNFEPVMNTAEIHAIEHLGATFLRNHKDFASKTIYFGPMGCRTGFYLVLAGDYESEDIVTLLTEMFTFIRDYEGAIPGASSKYFFATYFAIGRFKSK